MLWNANSPGVTSTKSIGRPRTSARISTCSRAPTARRRPRPASSPREPILLLMPSRFRVAAGRTAAPHTVKRSLIAPVVVVALVLVAGETRQLHPRVDPDLREHVPEVAGL